MLKFWCCTVIVIAQFLLHPAYAGSYEYSSLSGGKPVITIQTNPPFIASGDRAIDAVFCAQSDFFCFSSDWVNFSFPRNRPANLTEWSKNGFGYKIFASSEIRVFGICREIYKISSTQNGRELIFFFSPSHGLLGFEREVDGQIATYYSEREQGFGAVEPPKMQSTGIPSGCR